MILPPPVSLFFFFNDTATTEIYTLSLHDALPISSERTLVGYPPAVHQQLRRVHALPKREFRTEPRTRLAVSLDRKSTRLNSSHQIISYAVFCLKKKKTTCRCTKRWQTILLIKVRV